MKNALILILAAIAPAGFAQSAATPPTPPAPAVAAPPSTPKPPAVAVKAVAKPGAKHVTLQFQGRLGEALRKIGEKGGINLVLTGKLDEPAEVYLTDVSAEEALQNVADAHQLKLTHKGAIWTVRPMTEDEIDAAKTSEADQGDQGDQAKDDEDESDQAEAEQDAAQERQDAQEEARQAAQEAREAAREAAQEARDAAREAAQEAREQAAEEAANAVANGDTDNLENRLQDRIERRVQERLQRKLNKLGTERDVSGYGKVVVPEGETVENAVSYGGALEVYGHVEKDAVSFGGPVKLGPKAYVEGGVYAFGGTVNKEDGAVVDGDEVAYGDAQSGINLARRLRGMDHFRINSDPTRVTHNENRGFWASLPLSSFFGWYAVLFTIGFLVMMFAPNRMKELSSDIRANPLRCLGIGFLSVLPLLLVSVPICITVIGIIPVAGFWGVLTPLGLAAGTTVLANAIGERIPLRRIRKTQAIVLGIGLAALLVLFYLPFVGPLAVMLTLAVSFGAMVRQLISAARRRQGIPQPV